MTLGRAIKDAAQKARGRQAARYEIEVIPYFCGEIPEKVKQVLFAWERGAKLFVTDAEKVNPNTHAVFFKQYLRQKVTIYKEHNEVLPKEFSFKIQSVTKDANGEDERKTIGKVKVDLAPYCDGQVNPQPQDILLQCKPHGKLKVSVKAMWLQDDHVDPDAMTEAGTVATDYTAQSGKERSKKTSHKKKQQVYNDDEEEEAVDEQDLSGFDHATHEHEGLEDGQDGQDGKPRKGKGKGRRRKETSLQDNIPEGCEDPEGQGEGQGEERPSQQPDAGSEQRPTIDGTGQGMAEEDYITEGDQVHKASWRDYICCCCGPKTVAAVDVHETSNLLSDKQATAMDMENDTTPVEHKKKRRKKKKRPHAYEFDEAGVAPAPVGGSQK